MAGRLTPKEAARTPICREAYTDVFSAWAASMVVMFFSET